MNPIEVVRDQISAEFPDARLEVSRPRFESGMWMLDIYLGDRALAVDWIDTRGFGISELADSTYGEGVDEIVASSEAVIARIKQLLTTEDRATPRMNVLLARIREKRGFTQQQLAEKLGVKQATISGLERREDIQVSTLRRVIEALDGELEAYAKFPEGRYSLVRANEPRTKPKPSYNFETLRERGLLEASTRTNTQISQQRSFFCFQS